MNKTSRNLKNKYPTLNKITDIIVDKQGKPKPLFVLLAITIFATIGAAFLFKSFAASGTLYITPASSNVSLGSNLTITIRENSSTDSVNAVEADLIYDSTKLQFVSIDTSTSAFDLGAVATGGSGLVKIARAKTGTPLTGDQIVAVVTFTAIGTGTSPISFASTSAIVRTTDSVNMLVFSTPGTYTVNDTTAPSRPAGLTAGTRTVNSIALSWAASTDNVAVTGYRVYRNNVLINGSVTPTSFTDTGLIPNTSYSYTISAYDSAGNASAESTALAISTLPDTTAPSVPGGLIAGTRTVSSIAFSWSASTDNIGVTGYRVYRGGTQIGTTASTSFSQTGLTPNTSYSYTVASYDGAGNNSAQSSPLATSTLPDTTAPSAPSGLSSPSQATTSIALSWSPSTDNVGIAGYNILRSGTKIGTSPTTSYTDSGLLQGTSYSYTVTAYDTAGNTSPSSNTLTTTTVTKPGDVNGDGTVNIFDLSILASNFGLSGQTYSSGDLNLDGVVNVFDLSILATNWGT